MSLPSFNLNLLRTLDVLLETRNLTGAGRLLGMTQSAVSRQLVQLREQLRDPLLIREGQRYVLSERAESLRAPLKAMLADMAALMDGPRFDPALCTRQFVISGSDYIADHMLPEVMAVLGAQAPGVRVTFRMWESGHYRLLADEGVDLVPTVAHILPDSLHGRAMGEDSPVCAMRAGHPLAGQALSLQDYACADHLDIGGGGDKSSFIDQQLARAGLVRRVRLNVPFYSTALRLLAANDLLLTIPEHVAVAFARQAAIVWSPLPLDAHTYRYWLLWHARSQHDPAHQWLRNLVHQVLFQSIHGVSQFQRV
ncbi:LysR family transcriptional regulator [Duganella qianjiadongensis]|uniref:LysR family transcriptional regulator n=1 Tax=Duganella qianjiadongensis TaxID=2692176 RepID=A0ABW9VLG0_9BURK|nr:LysR family transcriptional regulator [Duganella qianjiadongensis]MYM39460.1 LysR family transcriptional regulator [Duganella qianjiadongensis]